MERSFSEKHQIFVGAAVFLALTYLIIYGYISDRPSGDVDGSYALEAEFDSVAGISMGSPVLMAGLEIGKVAGVRLDVERNTAILQMSIQDEVEIPYDSVAKILTQGVLGSKYIKISPGGAFEMLQDGEEFEYVQDSILFQELLQKVIVSAEAKRAAEQAERKAGERKAGEQVDKSENQAGEDPAVSGSD